ncbi:conserved hypothetical protein [Trichinella spiralis]|uniref:hypothetical protein n=1 Tax=Trichinella spiralis TaxID=6334 RepID=UPI0001EFEBF4|nr:conserved hypothetical protein [Trichinella spiralis]
MHTECRQYSAGRNGSSHHPFTSKPLPKLRATINEQHLFCRKLSLAGFVSAVSASTLRSMGSENFSFAHSILVTCAGRVSLSSLRCTAVQNVLSVSALPARSRRLRRTADD